MARVHRNLNKACWSQMRSSGAKVEHVEEAALSGVRFIVQPGGRAKVLESKCRSVHAYCTGTLIAVQTVDGLVEVTYNPYRAGTFTRRDTGAPVTVAALVVFHTDGRAYARLEG